MKQLFNILAVAIVVTTLAACAKNTDEQRAQQMIDAIEQSLEQGDYRAALDSIVILRDRFPKAVDARKRAITLWDDASLMQAEADAARLDSLVNATLDSIEKAPTLLEQNKLRNRRDSLRARYDAAVGLAKIIRDKRNGK
ncbi:MAG: hypothetical protein LUI08_04795 [Prevotella sp.]|nr:hypothetical protein [Prevotella sp.]MCD8305212.1 hypothetical protein [Prevotella sp.]